MALPIKKDGPIPSDLVGVPNGQIPKALLISIQGDQMHHLSGRAMNAMLAQMTIDLGYTPDFVDLYREWIRQYDIFIDRYTQVSYAKYLLTRPGKRKIWVRNGVRTYWVHTSGATAAVPGTSNHGLGLAADFDDANSLSSQVVRWLLANAYKYGYWMELASELWHWVYWGGDKLPDAVIIYESQGSTPPGTYQETDEMILGYVKVKGRDEVYAWSSGMEKVWLPSWETYLESAKQQGALAYFAGRSFNATVVEYDNFDAFRGLGPIKGPKPDGVDAWGVQLT